MWLYKWLYSFIYAIFLKYFPCHSYFWRNPVEGSKIRWFYFALHYYMRYIKIFFLRIHVPSEDTQRNNPFIYCIGLSKAMTLKMDVFIGTLPLNKSWRCQVIWQAGSRLCCYIVLCTMETPCFFLCGNI